MTYEKLNLSPERYQKFYSITPEGEKSLRARLENDPEQVVACKKRLSELDFMLQHDENRCHASRDQRNFLRRVLGSYSLV